MSDIALGVNIQQRAKGLEQQNNHQPCDLRRWVDAAVEQLQRHNGGKQNDHTKDMRQNTLKPIKDAEYKENL